MKKYEIQSDPVIATSVYITPRLLRQIFCDTNQLFAVNRNIMLLGYKNNPFVATPNIPLVTLEPSSTAYL